MLYTMQFSVALSGDDVLLFPQFRLSSSTRDRETQADRQTERHGARYKEKEVTDFSFVAFYYISVSLFVGISCAKARHLAEVMCIYNIQSRGATAVSAADKKSIN